MDTIVKAKATVTLEINCRSAWNSISSVEQVRAQASEEAIKELRKLADATHNRVKLIGSPKITVITFEEQ